MASGVLGAVGDSGESEVPDFVVGAVGASTDAVDHCEVGGSGLSDLTLERKT